MTKVIHPVPPKVAALPKRKRVAAYGRVSDGKDAMLHSLSAQVSYYSDLIQRTPGWQYAGVYTDEAVTGTKDNRDAFQRLIQDCEAGKIDMVITKSISRFARNTVTLLETVRKLKALGVDVYFEEQNIHTMSGDGELMLSLLASFAQEESRSVSENCKWRIRKRFEVGDPATWRHMYGYRITKGQISIEPEEAEVVRRVFDEYLSGVGTTEIARRMRTEGIPSTFGGVWTPTRVIGLLRNEKYAGNSLLQKEYISDHLEKKRKRNRGELPKYYAEGTHPAIISEETFQKVQEQIELNRCRNNISCDTKKRYAFSGMIVCGKCGKHYLRKTTHKDTVWNCSTFLRFGKSQCHTKQIPEEVLEEATADILGLASFDQQSFLEQVQEIIVPAFNQLLFVLKDGSKVEYHWKDRSRKDSWTPEMKRQAAECARRRKCK